jgi:hypothetical protein
LSPFKQATHIELDIVTNNDQQGDLNGKPSVTCNLRFGVERPYGSDSAEGENPEGAQPEPIERRGTHSRVESTCPKDADEHGGGGQGMISESLMLAIPTEDEAAEMDDAKHDEHIPDREGSSHRRSSQP